MSLEICKHCGWYGGLGHHYECDMVRGVLADRFMQRLAPIRTNKLGYGFGHVNVELSETFSLTFTVQHGGFRLCAAGNFFLLKTLDIDDAISLVQTLDAWYRGEVNPRVEPTRETVALTGDAQILPPLAPADELPWRAPESIYADDGPREPTRFFYYNVQILVQPTKEIGIHSGRTRFYVRCMTCNEILHEATTGPANYIRAHLREKHAWTGKGLAYRGDAS